MPWSHSSPVSGVTVPQSLFLNATVGVSKVQCTNNEEWIGPQGISKSDCVEALFDLQRRDVQPHRGQMYEFTSVGSGKHSEFPVVITPRKYDIGTCVVIIAMLERFHPESLPGEAPRVYARTDTATFNDAWRTALEIQLKCLHEKLPN
ncbi:hypothetical protein MMC28_010336, partial [Mycoblastus sanguinarius]|nr:hypothetical protein [Mycoblastus sanguinarius]